MLKNGNDQNMEVTKGYLWNKCRSLIKMINILFLWRFIAKLRKNQFFLNFDSLPFFDFDPFLIVFSKDNHTPAEKGNKGTIRDTL